MSRADLRSRAAAPTSPNDPPRRLGLPRRHWRVRLALVAVAVALPALVAREAGAFKVGLSQNQSGWIVSWRAPQLVFNLDPACAPEMDAKKCRADVDAALGVWNGVGCGGATLKVTEQAAKQPNAVANEGYNHRNDIAWGGKNWKLGKFVLAAASNSWYGNGELYESDVLFNNLDHAWGPAGRDLKPVLVHEIGHVLGVNHSLVDSYMNSKVAHGKSGAGVAPADDASALCFLYPKGNVAACKSDQQCPHIGTSFVGQELIFKTLTCKSGACGEAKYRRSTASKGPGATCKHSWECAAGMRCSLGFWPWNCGASCTPGGAKCHKGSTCRRASQSPTGFLCVAQGAVDTGGATGPGGEGCKADSECASGYCHAVGGEGQCATKCVIGLSNCGEGSKCVAQPGLGFALCVKNPLQEGSFCESSLQCETTVCAGPAGLRRCTTACAEDADCAGAKLCNLIGDAGVCIPRGSLPPAAACSSGKACATGVCKPGADGRRCRLPCDEQDLCGGGESCTELEGTKVCVAPRASSPTAACVWTTTPAPAASASNPNPRASAAGSARPTRIARAVCDAPGSTRARRACRTCPRAASRCTAGVRPTSSAPRNGAVTAFASGLARWRSAIARPVRPVGRSPV